MAIDESEIRPGIVIHVDPQKLISQGGCETIALEDHVLRGDHYFLVLERDDVSGKCLCIPLHSQASRANLNDWARLDNAKKSGKAERWADQTSHFFKWAFWRVPTNSFKSASTKDDSEGDRRFYGKDAHITLAKITALLRRARNPWRDL